MIQTILLIMIVAIVPLTSGKAQEHKSEVLILSTIHGAHKSNPNYSYASLFTFIEEYQPDVIGVEIRSEDIDSSFLYLQKNYPFEMYECLRKYPSKKVLGFDWLAADLEGRAIPENYWSEMSAIKQLQRKLQQDSAMIEKLSILDVIVEEKTRQVLHASLYELNDGSYDAINSIYYQQLQRLIQNTEYAALSVFYQQRDERIAQNIIDIIKNNKGKRIIFLVGADHRDYSLKKVTEEFKNNIQYPRLIKE